MNNFNLDFWLLVLSIIFTFIFLIYIANRKERKQLTIIFILNLVCTLIISIGVLCQTICNYYFSIPSIWFENIIYIGTCFLPVFIFFTGQIFINTKIKFKKTYLLLFVIPILSLLILWTNNFHHLFYINYSVLFY